MSTIKAAWLAAALITSAAAQSAITGDDRAAIQALAAQYAQALSGCRAAEFADLFTPTGAFVSGFRGRMVGRDRLIALVESERQCTAPNAKAGAARPGGAAPNVAIEVTATSVRGLIAAGTAEYQDEYVKTPQGWKFASRTVVIAAEKVTPQAVNFMAKHARGLICLALTPERVEELQLPQQAVENTATFGTAFTVSIDARKDITLDELRVELAGIGLVVANGTLHRFFVRHGITRKQRPGTHANRTVPTS